jgi:hypothetical protein
MNSLKNISRVAGIGYLLIFITGIFSNFFVLENIIVSGDASATAKNLVSNDFLYRIGILSFIIMVIVDLILAWALYILFEPVNRNLSLLSSWFRLVNATIFGVALYKLFYVVQLLNGDSFLSVFDLNQLHSLALLSLEAFNDIWLIGLLFFGVHLYFLGHLIIKSVSIPNVIGILLIIAAAGYLIDSLAHFLLSNYDDYKDVFTMIVVIPGIVGELSFTFWLLFKGVQEKS